MLYIFKKIIDNPRNRKILRLEYDFNAIKLDKIMETYEQKSENIKKQKEQLYLV